MIFMIFSFLYLMSKMKNIDLNKDIEINFLHIKNFHFLDKLQYCNNTIEIDKMLPNHIKLAVFKNKGWGLKTTKNIKKNELVYEYPIDRLSSNKIKVISKIGTKYIIPEVHLSEIEKKYNIFPYWDCFINHDEESNVFYNYKVIIKNKRLYSRLYALRDIQANEEILINYHKDISYNDLFYNSFINIFVA